MNKLDMLRHPVCEGYLHFWYGAVSAIVRRAYTVNAAGIIPIPSSSRQTHSRRRMLSFTDDSKAASRTRKTMLAEMFPRPIIEKTVSTCTAREPRGVFSTAKVDDIG